ncbi:hypothetical protein D9M72_559910 [compost metagenome]
MQHVDTSLVVDHLPCQVGRGGRARRAEGVLARRLARGRHQLLDVVERRVLARGRNRVAAGQLCDRHEVREGLIVHLAQVRRDREHRSRRHHEGVAVTRGARGKLRAYGGAGPALVVHHHGLPQGRAQLVGNEAADGVGVATGRIGNDDAHRLVRPGRLGKRMWCGEQRDGRCKRQQEGSDR